MAHQFPPTAGSSDHDNRYWTLPTRRRQEVVEPPRSLTPNSFRPDNSRSDGAHYSTVGVRSPSRQQSLGRAPFTRRQLPTVPAIQSSRPLGPDFSVHSAGLKPHLRNLYSKPASIPHVPNGIQRKCDSYRGSPQPISGPRLSSSTPNKDPHYCDVMDFSLNVSPIHKNTNQQYERRGAQSESMRNHVEPPQLISPPKSRMTSEEIFAIIHRSKKRLNIKTDSDSFSRSGSPASSLSPGSSESSINGRIAAENIPLQNTSRGRNSWSPNSSEYYDFYNHFENRASTPVSAGSRQSWACDRLGPAQTTRNDFKRLLLQHGPATSVRPDQNQRLSAVEQLKLSRQQKLSSPTQPRSPVDKRGVKFMPAPRSPAWKFASPRTDVLSSTILEDCDEEERAERSPQNSPPRGSSAPRLTNLSVRRPLDEAYNQERGSFLYSPSRQHPLNNPSTRRTLSTTFNVADNSPKTNSVNHNYHLNDSTMCKPMEPITRLSLGRSQNYQFLRNAPSSPVNYPSPRNKSGPYDERTSTREVPSNTSNYISSTLPPQSPSNTTQFNEVGRSTPPPTASLKMTTESKDSPKKLSPRELFLGYQRTSNNDIVLNDESSKLSSQVNQHVPSNITTNLPTSNNQSSLLQSQTSPSARIGSQLPRYYSFSRSDNSSNQTTNKIQPLVTTTQRLTLPLSKKPSSPELLSPSNVKENFNSFQIQNVNNVSHGSAKTNGSIGHQWNAQSSALISNHRSVAQTQSPKSTSLSRNILGAIETKSPQKVSLETSL